MAEIFQTRALDWQIVRPELTEGVYGKLLQEGPVRIVLTRVAAGGHFSPHRDRYGHLFYVLRGKGVFFAEGENHPLAGGSVVRIAPGEDHGYRNPGPEELVLLSLNIPEQPSGS
jgi:quercetin dioxygenase-like cupin family protein